MKINAIKKLKIGLAAAAFMSFASSCEVTDVYPTAIIPDSEAFATAAKVQSAVLGVYESAQRGFYLGSVQRGYPFGAANVQQGDMRGEDMYNDQLFYEVTYTGGWNPNSANNNGQWISVYRMVNRANIVLENIDIAVTKGIITAEQRDIYRGEMLFLRALGHHELLLHFARPYSDSPGTNMGVPYRTFAVNDVPKVVDAEAVTRGTVQEGYQQLLTDLNEAENLLPLAVNVQRPRKGAVIALKSRIKLHMEDWAGVVQEYAKLTSTYSVTDNPLAPFRGATTDNIFSFINTATSNPGTNGALGTMYGNPNLGARGLVKISPLIWRAAFWHAEDARRAMTTSSNAGVYQNKYIDPVTFSDANPIMRFSEVVLNTAEAQARLGNSAEGVALLNIVRDRALPATVPSYTAAGLGSQDNIIDAIIQERRIELLAEGKRWGDIHRLSGEGRMAGVPAKATTRSITSITFYQTATIPTSHDMAYSNHLFVWPIPLEEILNNTTAPIPQNPGY